MKDKIIDIIRKFHLTNEIKTYNEAADQILRLFSISSSLPSDEEVEKEGEKRYGEVTGGSYHAARPMDKARFIKGAKWMREEVRKRGNEA